MYKSSVGLAFKRVWLRSVQIHSSLFTACTIGSELGALCALILCTTMEGGPSKKPEIELPIWFLSTQSLKDAANAKCCAKIMCVCTQLSSSAGHVHSGPMGSGPIFAPVLVVLSILYFCPLW
jgi:hypothetical protein